MPRKEKKYHYIYKTTNILNNKFYIGMHSTNNLKDGYMGSGKILWYSINKYGKEKHNIEIIEFLLNRELLKLRETEILSEKVLNNPQCMNLTWGGRGGWDHIKNDKLKENATKGHIKQKWLRENDPIWESNKRKKLSESAKKAHREGRSTVTPQFLSASNRKNQCFIYSDTEQKNKRINLNNLTEWLNKGWLRGLKHEYSKTNKNHRT